MLSAFRHDAVLHSGQDRFNAAPRASSPHRDGLERHLQELMTRGLDGDRKAQATLLSAIAPLLARYFERRLQDEAIHTDDLVQEVLIAVHERRHTYDRTRPFTPWMFAVARYKLMDHFRKHHRHEQIDDHAKALSVPDCSEPSNARIDVTALLARLPAKQALAIHLTRLAGLSVAEAAARTGLTESDLKVSTHRGLKRLAGQIAAQQSLEPALA